MALQCETCEPEALCHHTYYLRIEADHAAERIRLASNEILWLVNSRDNQIQTKDKNRYILDAIQAINKHGEKLKELIE